MKKYLGKLTLIILFISLTAPMAQAGPEAIGTITRIQTSAMVNGKQLLRGNAIHTHDVIATDAGGRVEITFVDKTTLVVGGSSEFLIDAYSYDTDATLKKAAFKLTKGAFRMVTSALVDSAPENFTVTTPLATIGIRGTDFWGGFLSADTLDVIMLEGKGVHITTRGGTVLIDTPGFGVTVPDPTQPPLPPKKWGQPKVAKATATIEFKQ
ncbi:FecR family protein [Pseudodesulfovibrio sp.]|nr:FecR family protein [Pseudodesulfovibrio sp.]